MLLKIRSCDIILMHRLRAGHMGVLWFGIEHFVRETLQSRIGVIPSI